MKAYLNLAKNILKSNFKRLPFPYKLTFALTYWCNYRCKTCNIWMRKPKNELSLNEIKEFFKKSNKFNWIDFTGGEVWLRKDFVDIVEAAIHYCPNLIMIHFPTNGYMTEKIVRGVERIMKSRPPKLVITISMDGDETVNDYIRGVKGGWRKQIDTYKELHSIPGVQVVFGMTLSSLNINEYEKAFAAAKAECPWIKPIDFHLNVAHESSHYYGNKGSDLINHNAAKVIDQVNKYITLRGVPLGIISIIERRYLKNVERYLRTMITPMRCHALRSSCFVNPSGMVYPCSMFEMNVASLRDYGFDLQKIWELYQTMELQENIWNGQCPQCWTPCEAYQSIFGNLLVNRNNPLKDVHFSSSQD